MEVMGAFRVRDHPFPLLVERCGGCGEHRQLAGPLMNSVWA